MAGKAIDFYLPSGEQEFSRAERRRKPLNKSRAIKVQNATMVVTL